MLRVKNRILLCQLQEHPQNPRKQLTVDELSESIRESGLLVPLLVRRIGFEKFQIISGHRRRAALVALGEKYADCDVIEMTDEQAYKALMTTNIQSHSLSEIEEAEGIKHMMDAYEWTQERVAREFGKAQRWVSYRLSLLGLDEGVKEHLSTRVLTGTHAREIAQLPQEKQAEVAAKVVDEGLSTRETAELVKQINYPQNEDSQAKVETIHQIDDRSNNREIHDSSQTDHQIDDQLDKPKPEETRLYADPDMKRISDMNGFILKLKDIELDLQPHESIMDALVEYNRSAEALHELDKIAFRLDWMRKHISNAKSRMEGGGLEGTLLEFKRKAN